MREEAVQIAEQIRKSTERIRAEIERAHELNAASDAYVDAALESVKAAGIIGIQPVDGAFHIGRRSPAAANCTPPSPT